MHGNSRANVLEPASHNYWSPQALDPRSTTREASSVRSPHGGPREEPPLAVTTENPHAAMKTQHSQTQIQINFKKPQSIWVFLTKANPKGGAGFRGRAEVRKHIGCSQGSAPALTTQAPLTPDSWLLRGLEAPNLWPAYLYRSPFLFSRRPGAPASCHNNDMRGKVQVDSFWGQQLNHIYYMNINKTQGRGLKPWKQ